MNYIEKNLQKKSSNKIFGIDVGPVFEEEKICIDVSKKLSQIAKKKIIFHNHKDNNYYLTEKGWNGLSVGAKLGNTYKEYCDIMSIRKENTSNK